MNSFKQLVQHIKSANYANANQMFAEIMQQKVADRLATERQTVFTEDANKVILRDLLTKVKKKYPHTRIDDENALEIVRGDEKGYCAISDIHVNNGRYYAKMTWQLPDYGKIKTDHISGSSADDLLKTVYAVIQKNHIREVTERQTVFTEDANKVILRDLLTRAKQKYPRTRLDDENALEIVRGDEKGYCAISDIHVCQYNNGKYYAKMTWQLPNYGKIKTDHISGSSPDDLLKTVYAVIQKNHIREVTKDIPTHLQ